MLARRLRTALTVALLGAAWTAVGAVPTSAEKAPDKKRWEKLHDKPMDYAPFERRRAENKKLSPSPISHVLTEGFAKLDDLGKTRIVDDAALNKGLKIEVERLLAERGINAPPIEIVLVDDLGVLDDALGSGQQNEVLKTILAKESTNFTVASTGGGAIVLGLSVLKLVKSYDDFDFLVGHELSHILYDHFTEDEEQKKITKIVAVAVVIAALATRRSDAKTQDAVAWSSLGLIVANGLLGPAWNREQEEEADELGYELLLESNRSADGPKNVLEWYQKRDDAQKAYLDLMCGPDTAGIHFLKALVSSALGIRIPDKGYDPNNPLCQERQSLLASLLSDHPETEDRKKDLQKYKAKFYATNETPQTMLGDKTFMEILSPGGDMASRGYAHDGIEAFHHGDFEAARRFARMIPDKGPAEQRLPVLELRYYVANLDHKRSEALQYLDQATRVPELSQRIFEMAEHEYANDQKWADAAKIVRRKIQNQIGEEDLAYPVLIKYLRLAGKMGEMETALSECVALDRPGMTLACEAMAHPPPAPAAEAATAPSAEAAKTPPTDAAAPKPAAETAKPAAQTP